MNQIRIGKETVTKLFCLGILVEISRYNLVCSSSYGIKQKIWYGFYSTTRYELPSMITLQI